jgi:hypothetical protein
MRVFLRRIETSLDVAIERPHHADACVHDEVSPSAHLQLFQPDFSQDYPQLSGA